MIFNRFNNNPIDNTEFIKAWMSSNSLQEVANHFPGRSIDSMRVKATNLRKKGVKLPKYTDARKFDPTELNELIKQLKEGA